MKRARSIRAARLPGKRTGRSSTDPIIQEGIVPLSVVVLYPGETVSSGLVYSFSVSTPLFCRSHCACATARSALYRYASSVNSDKSHAVRSEVSETYRAGKVFLVPRGQVCGSESPPLQTGWKEAGHDIQHIRTSRSLTLSTPQPESTLARTDCKIPDISGHVL